MSVSPDTAEALAYSLPLDRPHRFKVGEFVRHVDDSNPTQLEVSALTLRIVNRVAFPTYTLRVASTPVSTEVVDDVIDDILCTVDLVSF